MARVFGWPFRRVQLINSKANVCTFVASNDGERERQRSTQREDEDEEEDKEEEQTLTTRVRVCARVCLQKRRERERHVHTSKSQRHLRDKTRETKKGDDAPKDILLLLLTRLIKKTSCCRNTNRRMHEHVETVSLACHVPSLSPKNTYVSHEKTNLFSRRQKTLNLY